MTTAIRLTSPASMAAAVPSLLGCVPGEGDLVLVTLVGKRVGVTLRMDGPALSQAEAVARKIADTLERAQPDTTVVHVIGWETATAYADEFYWALHAEDVAVGECLTVQGSRVLDTCKDTHDEEPRWVDMPADVVRPALIVETGQVVQSSREDWRALVAHTGSALTADQREIASYLRTVAGRDEALAMLARTDVADGILAKRFEGYAAIARAYPPADAVRDAALCLAAVAAWLEGNGALARIALEECTPGYTLAGLLTTALDACVSPTILREWLSAAPLV